MKLSFENYKKVLPAELLKKAKKNVVRECDEIEKGRFVAYVDEQECSFDVTLVLNEQREIVEHGCDCGDNKGFCQHRTSLLMSIAESRKKQVKAIGKNAGKLESILEEIEYADLKTWLLDLFIKNKDIELAFIQRFSREREDFSKEAIKKLTLESVKVIIKNKKNLDASEVKRIIELWNQVHARFLTYLTAHCTDKNSWESFQALIEGCEDIQMGISTSSTRIIKYIESLLSIASELLYKIEDDTTFESVIRHLSEQLFRGYYIRLYYLTTFINLSKRCTDERKLNLVNLLIDQYSKVKPYQFHNGENYTELVFCLAKENGLFPKYYKLFKPLRFKNEYNEELITLLIEKGNLDLAEQYCQKQIEGNFKSEYNVLYLELLKVIYTIQKDDKKLVSVLKELFPSTFDFDDFLIIYSGLESEEEKKQWRSKMLARARSMSGFLDTDALEFPFRLMNYENNIKKMIDYIDDKTPYSLILTYAERMIGTDKMKFMKAVLTRAESFGYVERNIKEDIFQKLLDICLKHFTTDDLKMMLREYGKMPWRLTSNQFLNFLNNKLG